MPDSFDAAYEFTLAWEKGYADDPADAGGATLDGVTQATFDAHSDRNAKPHRPVRTMTDAERTNIYRKYWRDFGCGGYLDPKMGLAIFDTFFNFSPATACDLLAKAKGSPAQLAKERMEFRALRVAKSSSQARFLKGWLNRDRALLKAVS